MSRINRGENIWRLHDHVNNPDGTRWLYFRNSCYPLDYKVHSSVFTGTGVFAGNGVSALQLHGRLDDE